MTTSYPSPETITRAELPNGITLLVSENHDSPAVVLSGYLWAGSLSETPKQAGLANLTAAMLMRGTETRSFGEINEALESVGAQLAFHGGVHTSGFGGKGLAEDLDLILAVLADCLRRPIFPPGEMDKLRGQILTDLQRRAHDTRRMADLAFNALLYPDHPYGRSVQGYEDTVSGLGAGDTGGFYRKCYSPRGMVVVLVGAVQAAAALDKVQAVLGDWRVPEVSPDCTGIAAPGPLAETRSQAVTVEGKTQADVMLGWLGMTRSDPDYMKANLANNILGVFGMMGRLGDNLRDRQGLAYYVYSRLEAGLGAGPWAAVAGVNPANIQRTVEGIRGEVRRLREQPVSADDLSNSQLSLTGSLPLRLETNEGVAGLLLDIERYGLGLDYLQRYAGMVNAVTVQDVQEMAQKYLDPDRYVLAVAGPSLETGSG
jgi:zinc protease